MDYSGSWTSVPSPAHGQSVDSGSETDAFSLIAANPELQESSFLNLDAIWSMDLPLDNHQPSSEDLPTVVPIRSDVDDWVQYQSQHDQPSENTTVLQRARVKVALPRVDQEKQALAKTHEPTSLQIARQRGKKVYDIATLLRLKETQSAVPVMLRVRPEAIAGEYYDIQVPTLLRDELTSRSRKHLSVHGSCDVTSTTNTVSGPFRRLQRLYRKCRTLQPHYSPCGETKVHDSAISSAAPSSRKFHLTATRWFCAILEATRFSSTPPSNSGRSHRSRRSLFATTNA